MAAALGLPAGGSALGRRDASHTAHAGATVDPADLGDEIEAVLEKIAQHHGEAAVAEYRAMIGSLAFARGPVTSPAHVPFSQTLPLPEVLLPDGIVPSKDGPAEHYTVRQELGTQQYYPGVRTPIWGFNGVHPGPTIIANRMETETPRPRGMPAVVTVQNMLPGKTIVHLHGGHQRQEDDGFPTDEIRPGTSRDNHYPNRPESRRAYTMWYHDHREEITSAHLYLGLAGYYILNDSFEDDLRAARLLPSGFARDRTGRAGTPVLKDEDAHDIPMLFQDRQFNPSGQLALPLFLFQEIDPGDKGVNGDKFLVNGAIQPRFEVATRRYRFRMLNGGPARDYHFAMSNGMPFKVIGTDGGLMRNPVDVAHLLVSVAERYEVILDFSKVPVGSQVFLLNLFGRELWQEADPVPIMRFDVVRQEQDDVSDPPNPLRPHHPFGFPDPGLAVARRSFRFERSGGLWVVNGRVWDADRDDATPRAGTVELWDLINPSGGWVHPIHLHDEHFRIVARRNNRGVEPFEIGHKDTVRLGFNEEVTVAKRFPDDFRQRFVFHCHNSDHEDHHMMGVFRIV